MQVAAFREGFEEVFPLHSLNAFYEDEIEAMLCGTGAALPPMRTASTAACPTHILDLPCRLSINHSSTAWAATNADHCCTSRFSSGSGDQQLPRVIYQSDDQPIDETAQPISPNQPLKLPFPILQAKSGRWRCWATPSSSTTATAATPPRSATSCASWPPWTPPTSAASCAS